MNVTITGPRSVGKTTISKLVAKRMKLEYVSSDELGEKEFKKYGGLDKVIKSGKIKKIINSGGYSLILDVYKKNKNFVFDLAGGAFTSRSMGKASEEIRKIVKKKSKIIGLLPCKNNFLAILILFKREIKRPHFKRSSKIKLFVRTFRKYPFIKETIIKNSNFVVYVNGRTPKEISKDITNKVKFKA